MSTAWSGRGVCQKCKVSWGDISGSFSLNSHVDQIIGNANRTPSFARRNIEKNTSKVHETACNTIVRPQLEYASALWDLHTKVRTSQIQQVQQRATRWTISNKDWQASATKIVQNLGWCTLQQRRAAAHLCLFYKVIHGFVEIQLPDYIQYSNRISRYCHSMTFRQVPTSRHYYKYSSFPARNSTEERPPTTCCMLAEHLGLQDPSLQAATFPPIDPPPACFIWF